MNIRLSPSLFLLELGVLEYGVKSSMREFSPRNPGQRFKAKSTSGGDARGHSKVEPYAYWRLDR